MSNPSPESELDLEKLFLPAWAQGSPEVNKYANYAGEDRPERRRDDRPGKSRPPRREFNRQGAEAKGDRSRERGPRPGGRPQGRRDAPSHRDAFSHRDGPPRREAPLPLPQVALSILPDERCIESLAKQIRMTGRAYPLFDIAQLILQKPERQQVRFDVIKKDGQIAQPLFLCALDDSLWLSEDDAVGHLLNRHFNTFYQTEKTPTDPPRGTYTFVAQCGISGTVLGPPNHHDYQNQLRKLHAERFSRMPFEAFKSRVKIVKDEAVVKKWIDEQSFKTEYNCLNVSEPLKLPNRDEVEKHFRQVHAPNVVKPVESHTFGGAAARQLRSPDLQRLLRTAWEEQRRFPLKVATTLSQQFASHGLQFFKVNHTVTHVSVARPHYLDLEATPVSEGVKKIVDFINTQPKCTRRKLFEALAPAPPAPTTPTTPADASAPPAPAVPAPATPVEATPEQTALASDLHWLIHQGHVIEFANGILETAKKPLPKPPKPAKKEETAPAAEQASAPPAEPATVASETPAPPTETASVVPVAEAPPALPAEPDLVEPSNKLA